MRKRLIKDKKRAAVYGAVLFVLLSCAIVLSFGSDPSYGDRIKPEDMSQNDYEPRSTAYDNPNIDLSRKMPLTLTKSGFRSEFKIEKPTYFQQYLIYEDLPSNGLHYGVYRDKALRKPVAEVDVNANTVDHRWESDGIDIIESRMNVEIDLEPGTYYVALYTTRFWDSFQVSYECSAAPLEEKAALPEGKDTSYYVGAEHRTVYFEIIPSRTGKIRVTGAKKASLQLLDQNFQPVSEKISPKKHKKTKGEFSVEKGKLYYVQSYQPPLRYSPKGGGYEIRYDYI